MNRLTIFLLLTTLVLAAIAAWQRWQQPTVYGTFDSPDGRWRLTLTDIDPSLHQWTTVFSIEDRTSSIPLSGTRYVQYSDSARLDVKVEWGQGEVRVSDRVFERRGEFSRQWQSWTWQRVAAPTTAPATAPSGLTEAPSF